MKKTIWILLPLLMLACSITAPAAQLAPLPTSSPTPPRTVYTAPTTAATDPALATCKVTAGTLNLRDAPGLAGHVVAWLYAGDVLTVLPDPPADGWIRVRTLDLKSGWVNSTFTDCKG